jgi:hypothetical protein
MAIFKIRSGLSLLGGTALLLSALGISSVRAETKGAASIKATNLDTQLLAQGSRTKQLTEPTPAAPSETLPPLRTRLPIRASIAPLSGEPVSVTLRNNSSSQITYEAITATDPIALAPGEETQLSGLGAPTTIAFWQRDGGLTHAEVTDVSRRENSFTVEFTQAANYTRDSGSIVLLDSGNIYLY